MRRNLRFFNPFAVAAVIVMGSAAGQTEDRGEQNRTFGAFVLDSIDGASKTNEGDESALSIAVEIAKRSIEIRRAWEGDDVVTPEEEDWYGKHANDSKWEDKPGGGPPPWAPAHGYRRKFGENQERDLGNYVHQCVQEGTRGSDLIVAIRAVIDRVTRGEEVGDRRAEVEQSRGDGAEVAAGHSGDDDANSRAKPAPKAQKGKKKGSEGPPN